MVDANVDTPLSDTKFRWSETALSAKVISQSLMFSQLVLGEEGRELR